MADGLIARGHHYSIVVIGPMNPRLHHPAWYKLIGAISEEEFNEAASLPNTVCVQPFAAFQAAGISITCREDRWEISTKFLSVRPRLLEITKAVFGKLYETPIPIFGINTNLDLETSIPNVPKCLSGLLAGLDIGLPVGADGEQHCGLVYRSSRDNHSVTVNLQPSSLGKDVVYVAYNTEYATKAMVKQEVGYFDIGELLTPCFNENLEVATQNAQRIVEQLTKRCGG